MQTWDAASGPDGRFEIYGAPGGEHTVLHAAADGFGVTRIDLPPHDTTVRKAFRGLGIRIEDNVAITRDEPRVLTEGLAKAPDDVEALMAE